MYGLPAVLLIIFGTIFTVNAHITLRFPPARYPPLDFLDNKRTDKPCGVSKNAKSVVTTLKAGEGYNVTWHMAYAHQGGYLLELLDESGKPIEKLTPIDPVYIGQDDQTREWYRIRLPNDPCIGCTIRLIRQAVEWGDYEFWSCADVDIVRDPPDVMNSCFGNGKLIGPGNCICNPGFSGNYCERKEDCQTDQDCTHGNGKCVPIPSFGGNTQMYCYCKSPYFGANCEKESQSLDDCFNYELSQSTAGLPSVFNPECYKSQKLSNTDTLYWRIPEQSPTEIEMVLDFQSDTWIAVGWRPLSTDISCYNFPVPRSSIAPTSLHPMDCTDIVIGSAMDRFAHVGDYYTRDRSTPLLDQIYDGTNSLTAAAGVQIGDKTIIAFRKPISAAEKADHSIDRGPMHVIWAKGQSHGFYSFNQPSGLDVGSSRNPQFYAQNELKYHGNRNRGVSQIDFFGAGGGIPAPGGGTSEPEPGSEPHPGSEPQPRNNDNNSATKHTMTTIAYCCLFLWHLIL